MWRALKARGVATGTRRASWKECGRLPAATPVPPTQLARSRRNLGLGSIIRVVLLSRTWLRDTSACWGCNRVYMGVLSPHDAGVREDERERTPNLLSSQSRHGGCMTRPRVVRPPHPSSHRPCVRTQPLRPRARGGSKGLNADIIRGARGSRAWYLNARVRWYG